MNAQAWIVATGALKGGLDVGLQADQMKLGDTRIGLERLLDPINDDPASVVATHDIHDDSHKWKERSELPTQPRSWSLCSGSDRDNLASFVEAAGRANPVRDIRSRALRAGAELRKFEHAVVSPPHPHAAFRRFSFRNAHKFASSMSQFQFVQLRPSG
jgi:hypothetical protein